MRTLSQYFALVRQMGPAWVFYRLGYVVRRQSGLLRRATPATPWEQMPAPTLALQARKRSLVATVAWGDACVEEAKKILAGKFRLFSHREVAAGFPPVWQRNWLTSAIPPVADQSALLRHWTKISDASHSDIKGVWELSRFSWAYPLVRAHARTSDQHFAEAFWRLFRDWCDCNPPNLGSNWLCGQEATFRLMATIFSAEALGVPETNRQCLAQFVAATGQRIEANLDYALSQKNNHGVSECAGLITVALLMPEHGQSAGRLARGLRELRKQLAELVYEDGGFSQHSLIYHRVLLHDLCWCRRRLELAGQEIPLWLDGAGERALSFLLILTDPKTGMAPLYGSNDGANVLPLCDADFLDMRPIVQMASAVFRDELPLPSGPWDEAAAWLRSDWNKLRRVPWVSVPARWHASAAGCYQLTHGRDRLFLRCPTLFRHRPAQVDMLHVDIWHDGRPITMDGGSFSYNSAERFTALGAASQHNVLTVDGQEPVQKFSQFLYLPWPSGEAGETGDGGFQASHDGYACMGIRWTREVTRSEQVAGFTVRDKVTGAAGFTLRWRWRLADTTWKMNAQGNGVEGQNFRISWSGLPVSKSRLLRADQVTALGWWSPYYSEVEPAAALLIDAEAGGDIELVTEFYPLD